MKRINLSQLGIKQFQKEPQELLIHLNHLTNEQKKDAVERLNNLAEDKFREFVESGGEERKNDRLFKKPSQEVIALGFDTEDDSKGNVHLLTFYDGENYYEFADKESALLWVLFADYGNKTRIVFCVNTDYDLNNLTWPYHYLIQRFYNKSRFIFASSDLNRSLRFYDLVNFYSLSAESVGKLFGLKKLHFDFKRRIDKNGNVIVTKKEKEYCRRDTEIAYTAGKFIISKFKDYDIRLTATVASCALQIYLQHFDEIGFDKFNRNTYLVKTEDIYKGYYGGRTEAFYYGVKKGNIKYYDINSLYPYVMKSFLYPNPYSDIKKGKQWPIQNGIVCATVKVPQMNIPPLPYRHNGKLLFPVGEFTGVWIAQELKNACDYGVKVKKVYWSYEYESCVDLFSEFVDTMYENRLNAKIDADKKFYKVVMNSLYGKFAEKRRLTKYVAIEDGGAFDPIVFDMCQTTEEYYPIHNNVIVSAYVTAYGRIELYNWLRYIEELGGQVLYCDTDSVIYSGNFELETSLDLGDMKQEANIKTVEILGAKYYRYETIEGDQFFVCKGVPKDKQADMFSQGYAEYQRPIRYRESIRRKLQPNVWLLYTKKDLTKFDKRIIVKHDTQPIRLKL